MQDGGAAYGLRVTGIDDGGALAVTSAPSWPTLHVETRAEPATASVEVFIREDAASLTTPAAHLEIDRARSRMIVRADSAVPATDLVHPCLWPAAAVLARWRGAETLHGGGFLDDRGGAWGVLGDRGAGKSSLLAALALAGRQIVADDLLVVEGRTCYAGPRCVDLRPETVAQLDLEATTTPVRSTQRQRLSLGPSDGAFTLRGFIHLDWGDTLTVEAVPPAEHFGLLIGHRRVLALGADHEEMLDLAGLPALRLRRPQAWDTSSGAHDALLTAVHALSDEAYRPFFPHQPL